ncbi:acetoacetate--CoA ligase [Nocardia fluminea]|uniref:Acetoacetyl-CoA synthetase n=1 Tax=Nocardia fluminea TaxID=134984 RepID=A0A2N3V5K1_9NOCA|nr:acetoacetate--CoA ligase [Nocardia fluminea]PKV76903.1 acetoacetyl-CoA synthetase [Nocardia fluminea]
MNSTTRPHEPLWEPATDTRSQTRIADYLAWLGHRRKLAFTDYQDLWQWSVTDMAAFWSSIPEYFEIPLHAPPTEILSAGAMPEVRWFEGATLNYAEAVLRLPGMGDTDIAIVGRSQTRAADDYTAAHLRDQVARARQGLLRLGVGRGDRVAAYLPNVAEAVVLLLAAASLGSVFSSCPPEFGAEAALDRLRQIEPKVLVVVDGYRYGSKAVDRIGDVAAIRAGLPCLEHVVLLPYLDPETVAVPESTAWADLVCEPGELVFDPVPFDHPLYVLYSSGTTGAPKAIVHGHGGILLEHVKALALHHDLGADDRFLWYTTTGWMMWNYLVSGLAVGASIVLFDGNPAAPSADTLWELAAETETTYLGTSAPFLMHCVQHEPAHAVAAAQPRLRGMGSTGAPLPPEGFRWVRERFGPNLYFSSIAGGTDVCSAFLGGSPMLPVYAGQFACRSLGAAVESYDSDGQPVHDIQGELVLTRPMPSMPVGFWGDTDGSRYRAAYFEDIPGVWRHGDWVTITSVGTAVIAGRSDATLNRGGVRLGTAEFYTVVEALPEVRDSLVVHLDGTDELIVFVVLDLGFDAELADRIRGALRTALSPRHVPDTIHEVPAIPRTLSGKKVEVPVKKILTGVAPAAAVKLATLANPEALEPFVRFAAVRAYSR